MKDIIRLWRGELTVGAAFWQYAVAGGALVNLSTSFLFMLFVATDMMLLAVFFGYGVSIPYNLLVVVGVWRAADRDSERRTSTAIYRVVTVVMMLVLSIT